MDPFVLLAPGALDAVEPGAVVGLPDEASRHLRTVLRLRPGAALVLADGAGASAGARLAADGAQVEGPVERAPAPAPAIHVVQGLAKGRKLDEVVRTLTELGVDRITPVAADRSVAKLDGAKATKAVERWRGVAHAAGQQSRRVHLPTVDAPTTVDELVLGFADDPAPAAVVVAHVGATTPLAAALDGVAGQAAPVVLAVGPEGGWTDREIERFRAVGATPVTLGSAVLRTEHAGAALAAVAAFVLGRMA